MNPYEIALTCLLVIGCVLLMARYDYRRWLKERAWDEALDRILAAVAVRSLNEDERCHRRPIDVRVN